MPALRPVQLLMAALLTLALAVLSVPAVAQDRLVILDGGKAWAVERAAGLEALPVPTGSVVLHKAMATNGGRLATGVEIVSRDGTAAERVVLIKATDGGMERIPAPKQSHDAVTYAPTPVMEGDALAGLVWIEGFAPNQTRVMVSDWTGSGWSQPTAVSDFGPGTQIALDLARLSDGSLLAVWAAFDGEDDEIVWSRLDTQGDGKWSAPTPLTGNRVPDVTPTLHATKDGAVVAWSGYDGNDYRIQLSRFDLGAKSWSAPTLLEGLGSVSPEFQNLGNGRTALLWRQAVPRTWMVAEMDGAKLLWTSAAPQPPAQLRGRPLAGAAEKAGGVELRWPIASDGVAKTENGTLTVLAKTVVSPAGR